MTKNTQWKHKHLRFCKFGRVLRTSAVGLWDTKLETQGAAGFAIDFKGCEALSAETSHKGCRTNEKQISLKSTAKTTLTQQKETRENAKLI